MWKPCLVLGVRPITCAAIFTFPSGSSVNVTSPVTLLFAGWVVAACEGLSTATATLALSCIIALGLASSCFIWQPMSRRPSRRANTEIERDMEILRELDVCTLCMVRSQPVKWQGRKCHASVGELAQAPHRCRDFTIPRANRSVDFIQLVVLF